MNFTSFHVCTRSHFFALQLFAIFEMGVAMSFNCSEHMNTTLVFTVSILFSSSPRQSTWTNQSRKKYAFKTSRPLEEHVNAQFMKIRGWMEVNRRFLSKWRRQHSIQSLRWFLSADTSFCGLQGRGVQTLIQRSYSSHRSWNRWWKWPEKHGKKSFKVSIHHCAADSYFFPQLHAPHHTWYVL